METSLVKIFQILKILIYFIKVKQIDWILGEGYRTNLFGEYWQRNVLLFENRFFTLIFEINKNIHKFLITMLSEHQLKRKVVIAKELEPALFKIIKEEGDESQIVAQQNAVVVL